MEYLMQPIAWLYWLAAYLIGGISFAYILGRLVKGIDLRQHGSGNLGSTNVLRELGRSWGFLCLFLDALKGALPVYFAYSHFLDTNNLAVIFTGIFAILGHVFTPYLKFKGGKGVATSLGVFAVLAPYPVAIGFLIFLLVVIVAGMVSLGSIIAALTLPMSYYFFYGFKGHENLFVVIVIMSLVIVYTHRANIARIARGQEKKIFKHLSKK